MAGFPIVGIGSSAGGLEALQQLFRAMPPDSGIGFVVAAHLDPTQKSHLTELLDRCTPMPVAQIETSVKVEPDHVYVIAPDQELTIKGGVIHAYQPTAPRGHRHPVDSFFRSLAEDQGECAIGIVLSGTGTNGSLGLRFIKAEGGIALAQDPDTAAFPGMPRSAIGTGVVDLVLPPAKMPDALVGLARHPYVRQPAEPVDEIAPEEQLNALLQLVRGQTKRDFNSYKRSTLLRRIQRRMGLHRIDGLPGYIERLRNDPPEMKALVADLTINVTGFFRDPEAWKTLAEQVIRPLVRERPADSVIRVWVPGCSTGEEAYSIAILIAEQAQAVGKSFDLRVFATDVGEGVLESARAGRYPGSIALDLGEERLERFFEQQDDTYGIAKTLRETITFAPQNLLQDPPFSRLDLISCRNLLIYLKPEAQKQVLGLFHFALREDGHLFLGPAETVTGQEDLFRPVFKKWRIYQRIGPTRHDIVEFPIVRVVDPAPSGSAPTSPEPRAQAREVLDRAILERHAPASVLIDPHCRVQYFRGPTEDYLGPPTGEPTHNLLAIARPGLRTALRTAVRTALDENREVTTAARMRRAGALHDVQLMVTPLELGAGRPSSLMVSFFRREGPQKKPAIEREPSSEGQLQSELDTTREDLRVSVQHTETANEELKASNEEIRSINEELQASNEELETSKEELQSLNEELNTVNHQLQAKLGELERRTDDLNNLLNSSEIATLFLDRNLCIRWFTPSMKALLDLLPTDIGRPVSHFAQRFSGGNLLEDARRVLEQLRPSDAEVVDDQGRWYISHMVPYRTASDRIDGVVATFVDITGRKRAEEELQAAKDFAEQIVQAVRFALVVLTPDLRVKSANEAFYQTFEVTRDETEGVLLAQLGNRQWNIPELLELLSRVLPENREVLGFEIEHDFERIGSRTMLVTARPLDGAQLILVGIVDLTERKRAEVALADELRAMTRLYEFSRVAVRTTDLQSLLEAILNATIELHGADFGNIQVYDPATRTLRIAAQRGFEKAFLDHFREVSVEEGSACGLALARGEAVAIEDVETEPAYAPNLEAARAAGYRAVQSTPLLTTSGEPLGMLSTHFRDRHRFAERELRLTQVYARQASDAIVAQLLQQSLRASEERFRQFAENSREVLWIARPEMVGLEYLSPAYERVWGEPRDASMADLGHWTELVHSEDRERTRQAMPRVLAGEPATIEYRIVRPSDGEIRWIRDTGFPIRDEGGEVHRAAGIARDITEEKRAQEGLRTAHQQTSDILESITDGFYAVDEDWRLTFVNRPAQELWRRPRAELLGKRLWDLFPDGDVEASEAYRLHMQAARERRPVRAEFESRALGFWVSVSIYPQSDGGLSVYFRDISDRKRAEEERELLAHELSHRVKNLLAVVQALAVQTDGRIQSVEAYRVSFVGRLQALARAHGLLIEGNWRSADLGTLVEEAVAAYRVDRPERVEVSGEPVSVTPRQGLGLSFVLHELGTNAVKYGALSEPSGRLRISWRIEDGDQGRHVRLEWRERHGARVEPPEETGFGTELIRRVCGYELDGEVELDYAPEGVTCELVFPLEQSRA